MFKLLGGMLAFLTLKLMLLPLTAILVFAGVCFVVHKPVEFVQQAVRQQDDQPTVVPAARTEAGGEGEAAQIGFPERMRNFGAGWRVLIWLSVIGSLPFAFVKIVRWAVSRDSNTASGALVLSLTAIGILLCLFLMGFRLVGGWEIFILCLAAVLAALHNFLACDWLADRCA